MTRATERPARGQIGRSTMLLCAALIVFAGTATAQEQGDADEPTLYERGEVAYQQRDWGNALRWFVQAANKGDAAAQNMIGEMYGRGEGVAQDDAEALRWFTLAAEQKNHEAETNLGITYREGYGVTRNYDQAYAWLSRAAKAPVRVAFDREEELSVTGYRPAAELKISLLPSSQGGLKALSVSAHADTGAATNSLIAGLARLIYPAEAKELVDFDVVRTQLMEPALAAAHRIPLNRIGEPIHITPARRIGAGLPDGLDSAVVMLDPGFAAAALDEPDLEVFWGAYLGTADETVIAGRLAEVAERIVETRARLRAEHGWIMDTYLLRRQTPGQD